MPTKVLVALSGGVDSSVAAYLLQKEGYEVAGATMVLDLQSLITGKENRVITRETEDSRKICEHLKIKHFIFDFSDIFKEKIIKYFNEEYLLGRTPNPCVKCNELIKFGLFLEKAVESGYNKIATGHYADIRKYGDRYIVSEALDKEKDQTYFLCRIDKKCLSSILFPLGEILKDRVKEIAVENGLVFTKREESQDVCFTRGGNYREFPEIKNGESSEGDIVDINGNLLGRHKGIASYTVGQRKGLGIAAPAPLYVLEIDKNSNRIVAGEKEMLFSDGLTAGDLSMLADKIPKRALVKIRYSKESVPCFIEKSGKYLNVIFEEPQKAVTPGQSAVFYKGDELLGGGIITRPIKK